MILTLIPDLMMRSKVDVAANHYGLPVRHARSEDAFREALRDGGLDLILVDLDADDDIEAMARVIDDTRRESMGAVVGFCSHVKTELIQAARAAGAHSVMANSTFAASVAGLVGEVAARRAAQN